MLPCLILLSSLSPIRPPLVRVRHASCRQRAAAIHVVLTYFQYFLSFLQPHVRHVIECRAPEWTWIAVVGTLTRVKTQRRLQTAIDPYVYSSRLLMSDNLSSLSLVICARNTS
ncbi:hypothetical protein BD311DRAFT_542392 [Dichomitus squalens]|uniref:Uncharacterized protein n=1 Tax=Dichomitus squalens TaxID=114155 RepID=A0A4Q9MWV2_9APHY|nr:hypothetical protein BD311DRAFT_542392 [Dichomitus squalens]